MVDAAPPDPELEENTPPKRRKLGFGWWLAIVTLVIFASVAALLTAWSVGGSRRAEAELALIRAAGEPLTPADLEALYVYPPPEEDVTALWLEGLAEVRAHSDAKRWKSLPFVGEGDETAIPAVGQTWELLDEARECLKLNATLLQLLHKAARRQGRARYPTTVDIDGDVVPTIEPSLYFPFEILRLDAAVRAHEGRTADATKSINAFFQFSRSLEGCPNLHVHRLRLACGVAGRDLIRQLLNRAAFSDDDLSVIRENLQCARHEDSVYLAGLVERLSMLQMLDRARLYERIDDNLPPTHYFNQGDDRACLLSYSRRMLETTKLPWHDGHQARKQLAEEFENEVSSSWLGRVRQPVSTAFDPTLTKPFDYAIRVMAAMRTADACLAAEQYRRREGDFPKSLDHLVPAYLASIPEDPFDGEPLRYIVRDSECVVYSIGMNERDDGGNEVAFTLRPDITFTVRNPAASIESAAEQVEVPVSAGSDNPKDAPPEGGTPTQQN